MRVRVCVYVSLCERVYTTLYNIKDSFNKAALSSSAILSRAVSRPFMAKYWRMCVYALAGVCVCLCESVYTIKGSFIQTPKLGDTQIYRGGNLLITNWEVIELRDIHIDPNKSGCARRSISIQSSKRCDVAQHPQQRLDIYSRCVACCSMLQCVAVCCSVLQCVAA